MSSSLTRLIAPAFTDAFGLLTHLADDIGARPSGSKSAALAVEWATERFRAWGIDVRNERVTVPHWVRGPESASIISHNDQRLVVTAMGGSVATALHGVTADVIELRSFDDLDARVSGKIVYFQNPMEGRSLEAYQKAVVFRSEGASRAAAHGAVAVLIRSVGSASLRTPHTGSVRYDEKTRKIPAGALSAEDAMLVHRLLTRGDRVTMHLVLQSAMLPDVESANVIAEIRGSDKSDEIVLIGAHLDSWDLGTGAVDNGSGVAMVMETMRLVHDLDVRPRRTIRGVLFMDEELAQSGSRAYFDAHRHEKHVAAIESDMGAASPMGFTTTLRGEALTAMRKRIAPLAAVGAANLEPSAETGVDTAPLVASGVPGFGLSPDPQHYFDYHHSAADTLDKVDPKELARCCAAVAGLTWILADSSAAFIRIAGGEAQQQKEQSEDSYGNHDRHHRALPASDTSSQRADR